MDALNPSRPHYGKALESDLQSGLTLAAALKPARSLGTSLKGLHLLALFLLFDTVGKCWR